MKLNSHSRLYSNSRNYLATVAPFILIVTLLVGLSLWELKFQDGGRVFLVGENLWAGAQKRATFCLLSYSVTESGSDLQCFKSETEVVLGDMQARIQLDSPHRSYAAIADGLVRGQNRLQDVPTAVILYDIAPWNNEVEKAIQIWRDSDQYVLRLIAISDELQQAPNARDRRRLQQELLAIDLAFSEEERNFTIHLNNGMHFLALCLCAAQGAAALILILLALLVSRRMTTVREVAQEQVRFLAYYDALTGLPNRTLLHSRLSAALDEARVARSKVAVFFVDLDHFKVINDSLGHSVGDAMLNETARRLQQHVRDCDTVARVGGDEFLVVVTDFADEAVAQKAAERILTAFSAGFTFKGVLLNLSCSIGISLFPEHGIECETLIRNADAAMYSAKQSGRNRIRIFATEMNTGAVERLTMENNLRLALEREEFYLDYQPQMEIGSGRVTGLEALLRWQHPETGLIPPNRFIQIAEDTGLILPIGEWALKAACLQMRIWHDQGLPAISVAVNVSAVQFRQDGFCDLIRKVLRETRLAPQFLELELTESLLLSNEDVMFSVLDELQSMGLKLTIDDFGTGYSSLSYLRHFPISKLKIDRSFIKDVPQSSSDAAIATAIISMGRHLNLRVIAEGVETEAQFAFLRAQHCDEIQGYYVSKPLSAAEIPLRLPMLEIPTLGFELTATRMVQ